MNIFEDIRKIIINVAISIGVKDNNILNKITAEPPKDDSHGDIATNIALLSSKFLKKNPKEIAIDIVAIIINNKFINEAKIAGPGFINLSLDKAIFYKCCQNVLIHKYQYGKSNYGKLEKVNIEYVSANPTGPMHIGHARGAVFGDSLANLLEYVGYDITREYYINDSGQQIINLAKSVYFRYLELLNEDKILFTDDMYPGEYLIPVAQIIIKKYGDKFLKVEESEWIEIFKKISIDCMMNLIKEDLLSINISHDVFTSENSLKSNGYIDKVVNILDNNNMIYEGVLEAPKGLKKEDWESRPQLLFKSTLHGDDLDRPLKKSDNSWTYFAADAAYHYEKYIRKFTSIINIWGADHGGYVKRIEGIVKSISESSIKFNVKLCQLVNLSDNGKPVKMSKRAGNFITMKSVVNSVGADVLRFIMLTRKNDAPLDFDMLKVKEQSKDNPVYYVQYANIRINSLYKKAINIGIDLNSDLEDINFSLLKESSELNLIKIISKWPRQVELAAIANEPHRITFYLNDLASAFHYSWSLGNTKSELRYFVEGDINLTLARLSLAKVVKIILFSGLSIIGVKSVEDLSIEQRKNNV
ncbi:MAG: arginine--tRNA ligase [Pelagibacterales bacterium]|mgnify:FL=1|nr:arginine--tRNA ligase [Pelagibacterales bacterium]